MARGGRSEPVSLVGVPGRGREDQRQQATVTWLGPLYCYHRDCYPRDHANEWRCLWKTGAPSLPLLPFLQRSEFEMNCKPLALDSGSMPTTGNISFPNCGDGWQWVSTTSLFCPFSQPDRALSKSYNSLGQNPCQVAAYLESSCHGGSKLSFPWFKTFHAANSVIGTS